MMLSEILGLDMHLFLSPMNMITSSDKELRNWSFRKIIQIGNPKLFKYVSS